jgi:hypothetical protein
MNWITILSAQSTDNSAVWVAAIGSLTSVVLALIAASFSIWNNKIAKETSAIAQRTEHTVNSKTTALEVKIEALTTLGAQKDETIAAQQAPPFVRPPDTP